MTITLYGDIIQMGEGHCACAPTRHPCNLLICTMTYKIGRKIRCITIRSLYNSERSAHNNFPMIVDYLTIRREVKNDNRTKILFSQNDYCDDSIDDNINCNRMANCNSQTFLNENSSRLHCTENRSRLHVLQ